MLDQRGVADRFVAAGQISPTLSFAGVPLDISDFPTRHPYVLALWQSHFEPILAEWVDELGVPILRAREVVEFAQDATGVDVELSDGTSLRAEYLVGCDGARSFVRKAAGIAFPGMDPTASWMIAEVEMDEEPEFGPRPEGGGIGRASDGSAVRVVLMEREVDHQGDPDLDDLRDALQAAYGTDFGARDASWISRFTDMTRQAARYRDRRVLLAGDAAHVHPPQGGQGLNTGVQDAVNLGWKLAQVVQGTSPETLLDTYHDERHPVGARVLRNTVVAVALTNPDERQQAVRAAMVELLSLDEPRRSVAANISALDIRYDLQDDLDAAHPLVGRRMPDLDLDTDDGATRVFTLLHAARPVLLDFGAPGAFDITPWTDRVRGSTRRTSVRGSSRSSARSPLHRPSSSDPTGTSPGSAHSPTPPCPRCSRPGSAHRTCESVFASAPWSPRETRGVSDTVLVILLVVCLVVAVGGFFTGLRLVRRVRTDAEAVNAEHGDAQ